MLKIQRTVNGDVVFTVSGRLQADNVSQLSALLAADPDGRTRVLDLKDLVLVDGDAVRFLNFETRVGIPTIGVTLMSTTLYNRHPADEARQSIGPDTIPLSLWVNGRPE